MHKTRTKALSKLTKKAEREARREQPEVLPSAEEEVSSSRKAVITTIASPERTEPSLLLRNPHLRRR